METEKHFKGKHRLNLKAMFQMPVQPGSLEAVVEVEGALEPHNRILGKLGPKDIVLEDISSFLPLPT